MIDIPLNKALAAVKGKRLCRGCFFFTEGVNECGSHRELACERYDRKDGKNVIFKLVDWSEEEKHG